MHEFQSLFCYALLIVFAINSITMKMEEEKYSFIITHLVKKGTPFLQIIYNNPTQGNLKILKQPIFLQYVISYFFT